MPDATPATNLIGRRIWNISRIAFALAAVAIVPVVSGEIGARSEASLFIANVLPWLLPWLLLLAGTRRPIFASLTTALLQLGLYGLNTLKLQQLGVPILPADLSALGNLWHAPELFLRYLGGHPVYWSITLLPVAAWLERPLSGLQGRGRAALAFLAMALPASLVLRMPPWPDLYGRQRLGIEVWLPAYGARQAGVLAQFLQIYLTTQQAVHATDPRALADARRWLQARAPTNPGRTADLPDIVVIQSESFFDPGDLAGVDTAPFAPRLDALRRLHAHGRLRVPAYGGLTTRSEFEFLTGFPLRSEPALEYPYQALVHRPMPALPWVLQAHGLTTTAVHPYARQFYQRDVALPLLGFEHFIDDSAFSASDVHGFHFSDAALNRQIRSSLDAPGPQFVFAISVENHGPWDIPRPLGAVELPPLPAGITLDERGTLALRQYLHHLARSDQALDELAAWVMQRPEPTLLLFYGDHLPAMHYVIEHLPWDDGQGAYLQTTPWLLVDNRRDPAAERIDLAASELAGLLLQRAGVDDAAPFAEIEQLRRARDAGELDAERVEAWQRALATDSISRTPGHH
jgi:phosphoglycerol transferase MdoB-like AlkP superfamily enzyme